MITFDQYLLITEEDEDKKIDNDPDNWHTFHRLTGKNDDTYPVNYKKGSYKKWAKENGFIDKVREKDKNYRRKRRETFKNLYNSGISKDPKNRTKDEQIAIDVINDIKNKRNGKNKGNTELKKYIKNSITPYLTSNFPHSNLDITKNDTNRIKMYKDVFRKIPNNIISSGDLKELSQLPDNPSDYTPKQKKIVSSLENKFKDFNNFFDGLEKDNLLSGEEKKKLLDKIYDNTEIGKVFKNLFINKNKETPTMKTPETTAEVKPEEKPEEKPAKEKKTEKDKTDIKNSDGTETKKTRKTGLQLIFPDTVLDKLSDKFKEALKEELKKMPKNMKELFKNYGDKIVIADTSYIPPKEDEEERKKQEEKSLVDREPPNPDAYCSALPDDFGVHFNQDHIYGNTTHAFIHECAHNIDFTAVKISDEDKSMASYDCPDVGKSFCDIISEEARNIKQVREDDFSNMSFNKYLEKYFEKPIKNKFVEELKEKLEKECSRTGYSEYTVKSMMKDKDQIVRTLFAEEVHNNTSKRAYGGVTNKIHEIQLTIFDMVSCGTISKFYVGGHKKAYCALGGSNTSAEAFAEMTQAYCTATDFVDILEHYFPRSIKKYNKIVDYLNTKKIEEEKAKKKEENKKKREEEKKNKKEGK